MLALTLLALAPIAAHAIEWDNNFTSGTSTVQAGTKYYQKRNTGAYMLDGVYSAAVGSFTYLRCTSGDAVSGTMSTTAGMVTGDHLGNEYITLGPSVGGTASQYDWITSSYTTEINQHMGIGTMGAMSWGEGWVRDQNMNRTSITYEYFLLISTEPSYAGDDLYYYAPLALIEDRSVTAPSWTPGSSNFIGEDGLLYGVPYVDAFGNLAYPDMYRVKLDNGLFAYISRDEMQDALVNYAQTHDELNQALSDIDDLGAKALQQAFAQYYGINALSYGAATECLELMRTSGVDGVAVAEAMETDVSDELAKSISEGSISGTLALGLTAQGISSSHVGGLEVSPDEVSISQADLKAIYEIARPLMAISIPAYAADGVTVVGEFSLDRI